MKTGRDLTSLTTEQRNPASADIDLLPVSMILRVINNEDKTVAGAVEAEIPYITRAVELVVQSLKDGGRLLYVGAGTSGRLGVLDAAECPPTFGTEPGQVVGIIAGGERALRNSIEGAEDDEEQGRADLNAVRPGKKDTVCGIAASRTTPYVVAALKQARSLGCRTVFLTTNPRSSFDLDVDVAICPDVGPEVIMGSTRMKSGTAQKMVLNMITTAAMVKLGKVYQNMMVDLQLRNDKLIERARRIVMVATGTDYESATAVLARADGHVKTAIVMILARVSVADAQRRITEAGGLIRVAVGEQATGDSA
jgi:N-acetylmuramic acid 6-phosphate etherase